MTTSGGTYIPGVCNINRTEIAYRRKTGHVGAALFVIALVTTLVVGANRYYRVIVFVPAFLAAIGYLQARSRFCVGYGGAGLQNAAEGSKQATVVEDHNEITLDKHKAHRIDLQAFLVAILVTVAAMAIPQI